jgi:aminoglycoside 3-N-acetyltransferase I
MTHPVQVLGTGDIAPLRRMLTMFGRAFEDDATYSGQPPSDAYLGALLASPGFIAVAAFDGDEVVGGITAYVLPKPERARSELYLYDLAVGESHRRRGIATAMIQRLRELAAARGAWVVFVQADHGDDPAIALYTKLGVREDVLHFDIEPSPGTT